MKTDISAVIVGKHVLADEFLRLRNVMLIRYVHKWGGQLADRKCKRVDDWRSVW